MSINLITRADDFGSSHSANMAIKECLDNGLLKNVSIMACCNKVSDAAEILGSSKDICLGLHSTINAEWDIIKWGSVSPYNKISSILEKDNCFYNTPKKTFQMNPKIDHIMLEINNQLDLLCRLGLNIEYADTHMLFDVLDEELIREFDSFCIQKGLLNYRYYQNHLPKVMEMDNLVNKLINQLHAAQDGQYLIVNHPAYNDDQTRQCYHVGFTGKELALSRDWQRRVYCDDKIIKYFRNNDIIPIKYTQAKVQS